jgi:hypothetical protein
LFSSLNPIPFTYIARSKLEQSLIEREVITKLSYLMEIYIIKYAADK